MEFGLLSFEASRTYLTAQNQHLPREDHILPLFLIAPDLPRRISMFTNGTSQGQKPSRHLHATAATWSRLQDLIQNRSKVILDGMSLSIADVVAVAQYVLHEDNVTIPDVKNNKIQCHRRRVKRRRCHHRNGKELRGSKKTS